MTVGPHEIDRARAGEDIVVVASTWDAAREELETLVDGWPDEDDVLISRTEPDLSVTYNAGSIRFVSAGAADLERGQDFDLVIITADAATDELIERWSPTVATTGGTIVIVGDLDDDTEVETESVLVCPECGAKLADNNPGASIRHEADGAHSYRQ